MNGGSGPSILIAHPGNGPHVRQNVRALEEQGMLEAFATTFVDHPGLALARVLGRAARLISPTLSRELSKRAFPEVPGAKLRTYPVWELARTAAHRLVRQPVLTDAIWEMGEVRFTRFAARQISAATEAVYGYEHAALEMFQEARRRGLLTIYEQPGQHHSAFNTLWEDLQRDYPASVTRAAQEIHSERNTLRRATRKDNEIALADVVLCNSSFTKRTLIEGGVEPERIRMTPLGFPPVDAERVAHTGGVRFLNAGSQSFTKGIHLLYQAWHRLAPPESEAELALIGDQSLPDDLRRDLPGRVEMHGRIHHEDLMHQYAQADVFVLPTLADGFGMVITEAMSRGLPVIATHNSAAPDLVEHGISGWVIPANDVAALEAQMRWCIENPGELAVVGQRAAEAARRWQWSDYRRALTDTITAATRAHRNEA